MALVSSRQMGCRGPGERHNGWCVYHHNRWGAVDLVDVTMDGAYIITTVGVPWTWWTAQLMALISSRQMGCCGPGERHNEWRLYHHDRWGAVDLVNGTMDGAYIITTDGVPWTWWTSPWMVLISSRQLGCRGPGERHNGWCLYHYDRWGAVDLVVYMRMCMVVRAFGCVGMNVG